MELHWDLLGTPASSAAPKDAVRVVLTAASHDATAHERNGHGVFTAALLDALRGEVVDILDAHGDLTLGRLTDYLKQRLPNQHPNLYGEQPGAPVVLRRHAEQSHAAIIAEQEAARTTQRRAELQAMITRSSEIMEARLTTFVGRTVELAEIRQRIADLLPRGGHLTITAPAGQGKSSVIARLVKEAEAQEPPFHFIPLDPGPDFSGRD